MTSTRDTVAPLRSLALPRHRQWQRIDDRLGAARGDVYTQGALALSYPLSSGLDAVPRSSALTIVKPPAAVDATIPDPQTWACRFLQAVVEVVSSERPLSQLARWTDASVYDDIARRQRRVAAHRQATAVRPRRQHVATVHIFQVAPTAAEVAARVTFGQRSRALAARLDYQRERWTCTALAFG